jgi:N-acetylmuramoyl-L-alanine amidase
MVEETKRAWHAGVSEWAGESNINSASVGIEIVNGGHDFRGVNGALPPYTDVQINAVIALSKAVMTRHDIAPRAVLGHSDIAPARKQDPGEHFPWQGLAAAGIGVWPKINGSDRRVLFGAEQRDRGVSILQSGLAHIGYSARVTGIMDTPTAEIITALQRRYRPDKIDGIVDMETMDIIKALVEMARDA